MKVKTEATFDASHRLKNYDGKCANLHGHRWKVIVWVQGELTGDMLVDFGEIKKRIEFFDHSNLNDSFENPTAENIAQELLDRFVLNVDSDLEWKVRVHESPKSYAEVETDGY